MRKMSNKDIIWIVAGNRQEFDAYVKRKAMEDPAEHDIKNYKFVYTIDQLRGHNDIKGFYIGSYKSRPDIIAISNTILMYNT